MSKKKRNGFKYEPTQKLPKLGKIRTEWDLKRHYYKSENDPQIEKDIRKAERAYEAFAKKYRNKDFTRSAKTLLSALTDNEKLTDQYSGRVAAHYFWYRTVLDARDDVARKKLTLIEDRLTKAGNRVLFFELAIGKIPKQKQRAYLNDPLLKKYRYQLDCIFKESKHLLTEPEEKILNLKSDVSYGMWIDGTDKILNKKSVRYKGEDIPLASSFERLDRLPPREKPKLWDHITTELETIAEVAENEMNAVVNSKKINDELRAYPHAFSATILGYENDERSVLALADAITKKGFELSRKFYSRKTRLSGKKKLPYANRNDVYGTSISIDYATAVNICRDAFYDMDTRYGAIFDRMLETGTIDTYPRAGKGGGAFCSGGIGIPTFLMLNHVDSLTSFRTLAHEMGHAIHTERSKTQPSIYQGYSTTTAETASTLFEAIAKEKLMAQLTDAQKTAVLHQSINEQVSTICRQIAFFNYERELHETIRSHGGLTWKEMSKMLSKHLRSYMGNSVEITERDGLSFVYVSHFRRFFYVYTYAYGELMSNLMYQRFCNDRAYAEKIDQFLTAGSSDTVENIFASIGINARKTGTFLESLQSLEHDINEFEKLTK